MIIKKLSESLLVNNMVAQNIVRMQMSNISYSFHLSGKIWIEEVRITNYFKSVSTMIQVMYMLNVFYLT